MEKHRERQGERTKRLTAASDRRASKASLFRCISCLLAAATAAAAASSSLRLSHLFSVFRNSDEAISSPFIATKTETMRPKSLMTPATRSSSSSNSSNSSNGMPPHLCCICDSLFCSSESLICSVECLLGLGNCPDRLLQPLLQRSSLYLLLVPLSLLRCQFLLQSL